MLRFCENDRCPYLETDEDESERITNADDLTTDVDIFLCPVCYED
jgi:hypothetical protein